MVYATTEESQLFYVNFKSATKKKIINCEIWRIVFRKSEHPIMRTCYFPDT